MTVYWDPVGPEAKAAISAAVKALASKIAPPVTPTGGPQVRPSSELTSKRDVAALKRQRRPSSKRDISGRGIPPTVTEAKALVEAEEIEAAAPPAEKNRRPFFGRIWFGNRPGRALPVWGTQGAVGLGSIGVDASFSPVTKPARDQRAPGSNPFFVCICARNGRMIGLQQTPTPFFLPSLGEIDSNDRAVKEPRRWLRPFSPCPRTVERLSPRSAVWFLLVGPRPPQPWLAAQVARLAGLELVFLQRPAGTHRAAVLPSAGSSD